MVKSREIDMTKGSILKKLIICAIPIILSNWLQMLFNATDIAVIGMFVENSDDAVAAVGSNGPLVSLIISLFIGFSIGANVVLAKCVGSGDIDRAKKVVGTSVFLSISIGVVLLIVGVVGARTFLEWIKCDPAIIDMSVKYLTIYFLGMPLVMLYNFLSAILRAVGDNLRPLIFLAIGGVVNVFLNVFFVTVVGMPVEGVAIATIASQTISAVLCLMVVLKSQGYSRFSIKHFRIYKEELIEMISIGLPSGIQSCLFSVSNVLIQSTVNSLGKVAMTANSVSSQFDSFIYHAGGGFSFACMPFVSQNYGAKKFDRIKKSIFTSIALASIMSFSFATIVVVLSKPLLSIMTDSEEVIVLAQQRLTILGLTYFTCSIMECISFSMRALGKSTISMVITLICCCALRILWLNSAYLLNPTYLMIFISYPISWIIAIIVLGIYLIKIIQNKQKELL